MLFTELLLLHFEFTKDTKQSSLGKLGPSDQSAVNVTKYKYSVTVLE